jgi:hypothetical protein
MRHACSNFERFALTVTVRLTRARHDELTVENKASNQVIVGVLVISGPRLEGLCFNLAKPLLPELRGKFARVHVASRFSMMNGRLGYVFPIAAD